MVRSTRKHGKHLNLDTHKDRAHWYFERASFPLRDAPPVALEIFWEQPERFAHVPGIEWVEAGPSNFPGRVTCLIIDPHNPRKLFAGSAAGGLWTSDDGGDTWQSCWPKLLNQNIGALAIHPQDGNLLFCATGEGNLSADTYPGSGIYGTSDGGLTWVPVFAAQGRGGPDSAARGSLPRRVGAMAFGQFEPNGYRLAVGAASSNETIPAALYLEESSGFEPCTFWGNRNYNCHSVVFHPHKGKTVYVGIEPRGTLNGIWRSEDFGKSWVRLMHGLPPGESCGRISLAISPSHSEVLYALIAGRTHGVLGVFRTSNGGESWREIGKDQFASEYQVSYNNAIAVHPKHPDFVLAGATDLHLTTDGGHSWKKVSTGKRGNAPDPLPQNYVHSDHHALVITEDGVLYSGNDGGVARSDDSGVTWKICGEGMVTAMFYAADVADTDGSIFGGGTQDNGTLIAGVPAAPGYPPPREGHFVRVLPGDGGWLEFDPADAQHVFGSTADLNIYRHRRGEPWAAGDQLAPWPMLNIDPSLIAPGEKEQRAFAVIEVEPATHKGIKKVYLGTSRIWRSADDGRTWHPISPFLDGTAVSAIECSEADPKVIFAGTSCGGIFRTRDGGETWSEDLAGPLIPRRVITRIKFHPARPNTVVVTSASTGTPGASLIRACESGDSCPQSPYCHVFQSDDGGDTWSALDEDALPDVVYNALAFETHPPYRLFVGGDAGVWMQADRNPKQNPSGALWASISGNLPNVVISDLIFHHDDRTLTAATFGRGIWRLKVHEPFPLVPALDAGAASDAPTAAGLRRDPALSAPEPVSPRDGEVLGGASRTVTFSWNPVPGAIGYAVDISYQGSVAMSLSSRTPEVGCEFFAAADATWKVWAILPDSRRSPGSAPRSFRHQT